VYETPEGIDNYQIDQKPVNERLVISEGEQGYSDYREYNCSDKE
jgi:hypothetical protein